MEQIAPQLTAKERKAILKRDKWTCRYCGSHADLQVDHIFPRSLGGGNQPENLAVACAKCNLEKRDRVGRMPNPVRQERKEFWEVALQHGINGRQRRVLLFLFLFMLALDIVCIVVLAFGVCMVWAAFHFGLGYSSVSSAILSWLLLATLTFGMAFVDQVRYVSKLRRGEVEPRTNVGLFNLFVALLA